LNENNNPFFGPVRASTGGGDVCWTAPIGLLRAGSNPPPKPVTTECDFSTSTSSIPAGAVCCQSLNANQQSGGSNWIQFRNNNAYSSWGNWNLSGRRCGSAESQARQTATNVENNWLTGQMSGSGRQEVDRAIWGPNWQLCTPSGQQSNWRNSPPSTRGEAQMNGQALGFTPRNAQSVAPGQLALPGRYPRNAGATGCG